MKRRRGGIWLALAAVLLAVGAWLMFTGQGDEPRPEAREVEFPRRMRQEERKRAERRRTQVMALAPDAGPKESLPPQPRDPVLAALPRGKGKSAVVIEANALRHSPIGELLLECLMRDGGRRLDEMRRISGVDPLQDLDRLAITDDGLILSGNFGNAKLKELFKERVSSDYGPGARVYEPGSIVVALPDGGTGRGQGNAAVATWNDQLIIVGDNPSSVKDVLDRVEGRGSDEPPVISEGSTYGEMYGVVSVEQITQLLGQDQPELANRLREVADTVELHLDARSDVAMVAEIRGSDDAKVTDLGKSLGAALSVARLQAQAEGEKELAQLLDFAKVRPDGSQFRLELAVPIDVIRDRLAFCRDKGQARGEPGMQP